VDSPSNRLGKEPSPYLRQHAHNPVDWYPWGEEALQRARREDKPILLSVGYSACHWCHVMAHESFESPDIAQRMNADFVNIKVDREERPDLDQLYQGVVQLMGRGGGWPLTVFLTPDLRPFYGGTYFPSRDRYGIPGFPRLLASLSEAWRNKRGDVEQQAAAFREGLAEYAAHGLEGAAGKWSGKDIAEAGHALGGALDPSYGGFGGAPKFPNPMCLALLLRAWRRGASELWEGVALALERMARGGIYDQLGGGFHRYSVDARWLVPHFEKMLYDNAQLIHLYSEAQQIRPRPLWKKVVEETVEYVQREMTSPDGLFYAAQDADSEGVEGKFFVWTPEQVDEALSPELAKVAKLHFNISDAGNFEHGQTVLEAYVEAPDQTLERQLAEARQQLFAVRARRVAPGRDDKVLAGWNGLMLRGLSLASRVFRRSNWAQMAARAADALLERLWKDGTLFRAFQENTPRIPGFIEDYGDVAAGLVALYQATFQPKYLEAADAIARRAVQLFWDDGRGAYLSAPKGQKDLLCPTFALHDNAFPSGASSLAEAQVALAALLGAQDHLVQAGQYLERMASEAKANPFGFGHLMLAADGFVDGAADVVIASDGGSLAPWTDAVSSVYAPTVALSTRPSSPVPSLLREVMQGKELVGGRSAAYLCRNFACEPPLLEPSALRAALERVSTGR
jgi:uncharacterized protein YyaL (SSP411 family)